MDAIFDNITMKIFTRGVLQFFTKKFAVRLNLDVVSVFEKGLETNIKFFSFTAASTDKVVSQGRSEGGVCKFGNLEVGIGGEINSDNAETICRCIAPPLIECLKTPSYMKD